MERHQESFTSGLASFDGRSSFAATAEATNLNGTGADMKAWLLDSDGNLAATRTEAETGAKLLGKQSLLHL